MKHIVIVDDKSKQNKALLEIAKAMSDVKILTEDQWEKMEDEFTSGEIKKGLKSAVASKVELKNALQKMRA